ncbi:hypothetical protein ASF46_01750 [Rathayibacter sp. Leaf296]|nr:hypothetical protein ASF46_01750 [Rathayibacter sp. Leaf296]
MRWRGLNCDRRAPAETAAATHPARPAEAAALHTYLMKDFVALAREGCHYKIEFERVSTRSSTV